MATGKCLLCLKLSRQTGSSWLNAMRVSFFFRFILLLLCIWLSGCHSAGRVAEPSITFSKVPPASEEGPIKFYEIAGTVTGATTRQKIVLFAHTKRWWLLEPVASDPYTNITREAHWKRVTHAGSEYAALLVNPGYVPPTTLVTLPRPAGDVLAVASVKGIKQDGTTESRSIRKITFSGYEWELCDFYNDRAGTLNVWDPANAWVDRAGFLHLRISKEGDEWKSAAVRLQRSLGYGSYRFVVQDVSHLEPAAVFSMLTWDGGSSAHEMDIEVSRWGQPASKNAQFLIQPYYVAANVVRFETPAGPLTYSFRWEPGRVSFKAAGVARKSPEAEVIAEHTFTMGVPMPKNDCVRINLYRFGNRANPLRNGAEVIVEKFEYLP